MKITKEALNSTVWHNKPRIKAHRDSNNSVWEYNKVSICIYNTTGKITQYKQIIKDSHPSQIFFTLLLSWSPWKNIIKTHLLTWSPVLGSSRGVSISACLKKTFPRQARHRRRSKEGTRSLAITPVTKLDKW